MSRSDVVILHKSCLHSGATSVLMIRDVQEARDLSDACEQSSPQDRQAIAQ